ncbi:DDE superfamily endonuclease [Rhizobium azibense]|nr:DDE superfamily endonuclease [Rhizobium azibense]TDW26501.1 DDE superfamily endonuclease [Rhizobium azibense]
MVEDMPAARGIIVSHQTIRLRAGKFGRTFANDIRRRSSGRLGHKWHLDEAVVSIRDKKHWLWRTLDQDGFVLDVLIQSHRYTRRPCGPHISLLLMLVSIPIVIVAVALLIVRVKHALEAEA